MVAEVHRACTSAAQAAGSLGFCWVAFSAVFSCWLTAGLVLPDAVAGERVEDPAEAVAGPDAEQHQAAAQDDREA